MHWPEMGWYEQVPNPYYVTIVYYHDYIFIDRAPYKQLHGILQISVQISMFSPHMQKVAFSA